jgi:c-di-GMP-binding flagellar brake protein YcgR
MNYSHDGNNGGAAGSSGASDTYFDMTIDKNFIATAITSVMHMREELNNDEYVTLEYIEMDGDYFNLVVKLNKVTIN